MRVVCELWWMDLTTCDVSASPEAVICQMHTKEMIRPPGGGAVDRLDSYMLK